MKVPYLDLRAQYDSVEAELWPAIRTVFETSTYILGPAVADFESAFAKFCGSEHCVAVNNGTAALHLALLAHGIGPGDEVITQANTFIATVAAILYTGATPVLVDVKDPDFTIDPEKVESALTPRTRAILPVHLFGQPCRLRDIESIAQRRGIVVIEDASQAHGASYDGEVIGSRNTATFSFYPGKNLGAAGEGGAIVTRDASLAARMRRLRNHGSDKKYLHEELGFNYRLEGLQGAVLGVKLRHLAAWTRARQEVARMYDRQLISVTRPQPLERTTSAYHIYPVLVDERENVRSQLAAAGIEVNVHYPVPCHLQSGYQSLGYARGAFPATEYLAEHELSLPIYPEMGDEQVEYVARILQSTLSTNRAATRA